MPFVKSEPIIPLYHPTSVLLVDDDESFLRSLQLVLEDGFECHTFCNASEAIAFLRSEPAPLATLASGALEGDEALMEHIRDPEHRKLHLKVSRLPRLFADNRRFTHPSVIVADQTMPGLSGLDMLDALRDLPLRKLLLSGTADEGRVRQAVASGQIDDFHPKQRRDLHECLIARLKALQLAYFDAVTRPFEPALATGDTRFLRSEAFGQAFARFAKEHGIVEHCVLVQPPGILGLDEYGARAILLAADDDYRQATFEIAQAEDAPVELLRQLANPTTLALFPTTTGFYSRSIGKNWRRYLCGGTSLGEGGLSTAIINNPEVVHQVCASVSSYADHRLCRLN